MEGRKLRLTGTAHENSFNNIASQLMSINWFSLKCNFCVAWSRTSRRSPADAHTTASIELNRTLAVIYIRWLLCLLLLNTLLVLSVRLMKYLENSMQPNVYILSLEIEIFSSIRNRSKIWSLFKWSTGTAFLPVMFAQRFCLIKFTHQLNSILIAFNFLRAKMIKLKPKLNVCSLFGACPFSSPLFAT